MPDLDIGIYICADELQSKYEDSNVNCKYILTIN